MIQQPAPILVQQQGYSVDVLHLVVVVVEIHVLITRPRPTARILGVYTERDYLARIAQLIILKPAVQRIQLELAFLMEMVVLIQIVVLVESIVRV